MDNAFIYPHVEPYLDIKSELIHVCVLVFIMERAFAITDNKKIIAVFVFLFFTGEWRSRLTVLILNNDKEDAQQLQSLFPYILSEKILRRENTYTLLARIL